MKRFKRFLANVKGSAFIENLMVYICVAAIGLIVVGIIGKTINDAASGSPYQDEIVVNGGNGGSSSTGGMSNEEFYALHGFEPGVYYFENEQSFIRFEVSNDNSIILTSAGSDMPTNAKFTYNSETQRWICPETNGDASSSELYEMFLKNMTKVS